MIWKHQYYLIKFCIIYSAIPKDNFKLKNIYNTV